MRLRRSDFVLDDVSAACAWGSLRASLRQSGYDTWRGRQGWWPDHEQQVSLLVAWFLLRARHPRARYTLQQRVPPHLWPRAAGLAWSPEAAPIPPRPIPRGIG